MLLMCFVKDEVNTAELNKLLSLSSDERIRKAEKLPDNHKKAISLTAGLLEKILKEKHGFAFTSISHSGNYAACLGENVPCGLDIEKIAPRDKKLIQRVCTEKELLKIESSLNPEEEFIKLWTIKEASFKAGIGTSLPEFFKENEKIESLKEDYTYETDVINGYAVTTCVKKG